MFKLIRGLIDSQIFLIKHVHKWEKRVPYVVINVNLCNLNLIFTTISLVCVLLM